MSVKVNVYAKVLKFETPSSGINFPSEMQVRYTIQDRSSGEIIYDNIITYIGKFFNGVFKDLLGKGRIFYSDIGKSLS